MLDNDAKLCRQKVYLFKGFLLSGRRIKCRFYEVENDGIKF